MNHSDINTGVSIDPRGLDSLKVKAREGSDDALREAAQQFEAKFIQMLLQSMRATVPESEFSGKDEDLYQGMMDEQMAQRLASGKGFGLSESIVRQLKQAEGREGNTVGKIEAETPFSVSGANGSKDFAVPPRLAAIIGSRSVDQLQNALQRQINTTQQTGSVIHSQRVDSDSAGITRQQKFVTELLPHAQRAGKQLGVAPEVLIAQAALETGWGEHVIQRPNGASSNNLFNIKATNSWRGETATVGTIEYIDGIAKRQRDSFRAYDSPQHSFDDYVNLIAGQPRYAQAVQQAGNAQNYLKALEQGGYATDPNYADKVLRVLQHPALAETLKNHADQPIQTTENTRVNNAQG